MITETYTPSDGNPRTIRGKVFGDEFRIYAIHGDVTNHDMLQEIAQEIAAKHATPLVTYVNI